ncbi:hypothetical protein N5853_00885 [Bartonella sp. HY329]|uniref:hypothetical protein n=1 Tax=unclassified Bartonella TaxID=2645622 RepID=UPI0021CA392D|nr:MULTISPECIES: hypothetical protein [unclassified Bartonella]UXM95244.1 hypothetical protein N5853_00885 [Bartonella sp. HY329]UXN09568.1 hypothetical protein N5852_00890 [Bartonella sp. HY328]
MTIENDIVNDIGAIMFRSAKQSAFRMSGNEDEWDYGVYVFTEGSGDIALYFKKKYISYSFGDELLDILNLFENFRDITRVDGDKPWLKCKAAIRKSDRQLKMLFEFDDLKKWSIGPNNLDKQYEILLGDIFPEALEIQP